MSQAPVWIDQADPQRPWPGVRLIVIISCLGFLAACTGVRARPVVPRTEALIVVFVDDFHSGVLLERAAVPAELLPAGGRTVPGSGWVVLHFGERRWIRGEADGCIDGLRLALFAGDGGVQMDLVPWWRHARGGTDPSRARIWVFTATHADVAGVVTRLRSWIAKGGTPEFLAIDTCWWRSTHAWTLANNCHDFTVDLLAGAGLELDRPMFIQADGMRASLDRVWAERVGEP
jgi:hypothetical protein